MSYAGSGGDDQSEDGELRHSPSDLKKGDDVLDFSLSDEDADTADSLDIKPPQANRLPHSNSGSSRNKRRDRNREGRSRHGRSERHRDVERGHGHREKHHRERSNRERDTKYEREAPYREKEHFRERDMYREKELYMAKQEYAKESFREQRYSDSTQVSYKDSKYMELQQYSRRDELKYPHESTSRAEVRYVESSSSRKYDESKRQKDMERYNEKEMLRYGQDPDKSRRYEEKQDRRLKSAADQTLDDLRERLLDKKRMKESSDEYKHYEKESRRKYKDREVDSTSVEDAEMYVKEIIDLSTADDPASGAKERKDKHKREPKEEPMDWSARVEEEVEVVEKKQLTDAEREEQEMRKEKLLEAEREIARQKEQYKLDRERRHQRRLERQEAKRRLLAEQEQEHQQRKRQRMSGELGQYKDKDLSIVTVSDNSSAESSDNEVERQAASDSDEGDQTADEDEPEVQESAAGDTSSGEEHAAASDSERSEHHRVERSDDEEEDLERNQTRYKDQESPMSVGGLAKSDRSTSRSRSRSPSPKSNGQAKAKEKEEPKPKSPEPLLKKLDEALPPYFPAIQGCRSVEEFQCLNRIEEGTYGVVYRARDKRTEEIVALKRLKMEKEKEGFPITSLREINTLLKGQHPNIVTVREIVVGSNMDKIFIVMDYVEHDLKSLMETMRNRRQVFVPGEVKCLLKQLLGAVAHLHDNWILHRDLKTSNLLLSHKGILKVGDFGLAREYGSPLKAYTPIVVTLWYRAPELLLCCKEYSTPIDMWSVGCIFAELLLMNALFPGKSEVDQLNRIFKDLGTPNEKIWPGYNELPAVKKMKFTEFPVSQIRNRFGMLSELGQNLLQRFLTYDPAQRITAEDALQHAYFSEAPLPIDPAMFPTWPAKSELGHRKAMAASPKPPSGGREYKQLGDGDEDSALGFHMGGSSSSTSLLEARRLAMGGGFSLKF